MMRSVLLLGAILSGVGIWYGATTGQPLGWLASAKAARASMPLADTPPSAPGRVTQQRLAPVPVVAVSATPREVPITRSSTGWVEPVAQVTVRARVDGMIVARHVRDGAMVSAGEVLFQLDDREIRAQVARAEAAVARDQAVLAREQAALRRAQELLARSVATHAQAEEAAANVRIAAANLAASDAALALEKAKLSHTKIAAPIAGRAGVVRAHEGHIVRGSDVTGDGLVTITQMSPLRVSFALPERDLPLLHTALSKPERKASVRVHTGQDGGTSSDAELSFIDSFVEVGSATILVKATLIKNASLWPGQYVRVEVDLGSHPEAVTVPLVALRPGNEGAHVFVVHPSGTAQMRRVEPLETRGEVAIIVQGLSAGERVVLDHHPRLEHGIAVVETVQATASLAEPPSDVPSIGHVPQ